MLDNTERQDDFARTRNGYSFLVDTFRQTLPEPPKETPEVRYKRMKAAIAAVASLCPVGIAEANLAARHVAADQHAMECLRQANQYNRNQVMLMKCQAQSNSMGRQADSALRSLLRLQAMRMKRDAKREAAEAAVWAEHIAAEAMMAAFEPAAREGEPVAPSEPAVTEAETPEAVVTEAATPARTVFVRPFVTRTEEEMVQELAARSSRGGLGAVSETQSQFANV